MKKTTAYARKKRQSGQPIGNLYGRIKLPINFRHSATDELNLQLLPHVYLDGFRDGTAEETDWHALALRLNCGHVLANAYFPDVAAQSRAGLDALRGIKTRHERTGKWGISQPEFDAIGPALGAMDAMQLQSNRRQLREVMQAVYGANEDLQATGAITTKLECQSVRQRT